MRPDRMLELGARRMLAVTGQVWRDGEDDRLGRALALTLTRPDLTEDESTGWLSLVDARFSRSEPGPMPAEVSNSIRTLRLLYVLADRGVRAEPEAVPVPLAHREHLMRRLAASMEPASWPSG